MNSTLKLVASFLLIVGTHNCYAQAKGTFYAFDAKWQPAKSMDSCTYFMHEMQKSDTEFICRYYQKVGPMIRQEVYKDVDLSVPNGFFCWYNEKGKIDSSGHVVNAKKDSRWEYYLGDSLQPTYYDEYSDGKFIKRVISQKNADSEKVETDVTQKEAVFQKGVKDWNKYLQRNLRIPDRLISIVPGGIYTVNVCFLVDKIGKVTSVYLRRSLEWSADAEVFRIVEHSPDWQPAMQYGRPVYYREMQNISFEVSK